MISFPNAKINLGLHVTKKREDGFHDIETVFYPTGLCDLLELIRLPATDAKAHTLTFASSGIPVPGEGNLCEKSFRILRENARDKFPSCSLKMHLHKIIPIGAGLGGGSSDAASTMVMINNKLQLGLTEEELIKLASQVGSDCAFFIKNKPVFATGKGDVFESIQLNLASYFLALVLPEVHVSTPWAYSQIEPLPPKSDLRELLKRKPKHWKNELINDFEKPVFLKFPQLKSLKEKLYESGAVYASMSGSGSALYGIFKTEPNLKPVFHGLKIHIAKL